MNNNKTTLFLICVIFIFPTAYAQSILEGSIAGEFGYPYRLYVPDGASAENPLPLVMFLAGLGAGGSNNTSQVTGEGFSGIREATRNGKTHAAIVVAPQSPNGWWNGAMVNALAEHIANNYPVDQSRQYVLGHSAGGEGTYYTISDEPSRWAAAVPICAVSSSIHEHHYQSMADVPVWLIHGNADKTVNYGHSTTAYNLLNLWGGSPRYTIVEGGGHGIFTQVYRDQSGYTDHYTGGDPLVTDTGLYRWLWSQSTPRPEELKKGQVIQINFGTQFTEGTINTNETYWNIPGITPLLTNGTYYSLRNDNGDLTRVDLEILNEFLDYQTVNSSENADLMDWVLNESWWTGSDESHDGALTYSGDLRLKDLPRNAEFKVSLIVAKSNGGENLPIARHIVNGLYQDINTNDTNTLIFTKISSGNDGIIQLSSLVSPEGDALGVNLSGVILEYITDHDSLIEPKINIVDKQLLVYPQKTLSVGANLEDEISSYWANWRLVSGPALVQFSERYEMETDIHFNEAGDYIFEISVSDGLSVTRELSQIRVMDVPKASTALAAVESGLSVSLYNGQFTHLPNFDNLEPEWNKRTSAIQLSGVHSGDHFALLFEGYIEVPELGEYILYLKSDEGSRLYVDGELVIDHDGIHRASERSGFIDMYPGYHDIRVEYFEAIGSESLELYWSYAGTDRQLIPTSAYFISKNWRGYPRDSSGYIDTEEWMGKLYPYDELDWAYSVELENWIQIPQVINEGGAWIYIMK